MKPIRKLGYDCGWGNRDYGCQDGPLALDDVYSIGASMLAQRAGYKTKEQCLPALLASLDLLKEAVTSILQDGEIPVVIGGDHTSAIATWAAVTEFYKSEGNTGLLWLDAHMDAHTAETAHEGKWGGWWHGMPIATLTGGEKKLFERVTGGSVKIAPSHIHQIGIRSYEPAEQKYVEANKINVTYAKDIKASGFGAVFTQALEALQKETKYFGMSIDLDGFDPADAPAVGTPEAGGLRLDEVLEVLRGIGRHENFTALEIAEFNPHHDENHKTEKAIERLLEAIFA